MDRIVHHASPGAIGQTPDANSEKSDSAPKFHFHVIEEYWNRKSIPPGLQVRMATIDRVVQSITSLHGMLQRDERAMEWIQDNESAHPPATLGSYGREELNSTIDLLLRNACDVMEDLRENCDALWRSKGGAR